MVTVYLAIVGVLVCGIGYFLYTPFPDYMDRPWELQKVFAQIKIGAIIAAIAHTVGFGEKLDLNRKWTYKWALLSGVPSNYLEKVKITDTTFDGVPVRIYRPLSAAPDATLPALVYYHGGGWVLLDVETYDSPMAEICRQANIVVISVE
ncbi:neutral cholesterol ester hydrolase 1-like [Gigantopelta aegis]|uniref:neutral cholesterol ester hydrolase 1-like n=1 Tax=Gigantopelta aegis TaxID=1735272 RepID=UPI001B88B4BD|nr:neutral cholesterol ester hydrolase 1-like [Gigantopelta aegis]